MLQQQSACTIPARVYGNRPSPEGLWVQIPVQIKSVRPCAFAEDILKSDEAITRLVLQRTVGTASNCARGLGSRSNARFTATDTVFGSKKCLLISCNMSRKHFGQNYLWVAKWSWT